MRLAKTNDIWRGLYKPQKRPIETIQINYKETSQGPALELSLYAPISLLCGENGVGKTRALRAVLAALGGKFNAADFRPTSGPKPLEIISVSAQLRRPAGENNLTDEITISGASEIAKQLTDDSGEVRIYSFDPTLQIPYLLHLLRHDSSLSDLWEGVSPKKLSSDDLSDISSLVGRTYTEANFYEVTDYQDHEVVPYFRVTSNGATYGAEEMGLGELSLLFYFWIISRVKENSVLLLEEPETFVAPASQRYLVDLLASAVSKNKVFAVIASHSGIIAERVPGTHTHYVSRMGKNVVFNKNPSKTIMTERLGLVPPKSSILILEDKAGVFLARSLLEAGNSKYLSRCTFAISGGESEITNILSKIQPSDIGGSTVIMGLYDGDQRGSLPRDLKWPVVCLMGNTPPEELVQRWLSENESKLPELLNRSNEDVLMARSAVDGKNHHDWLIGLSSLLHMSLDELFRCFARGIRDNEYQKLSAFIHEFESKFT